MEEKERMNERGEGVEEKERRNERGGRGTRTVIKCRSKRNYHEVQEE